MSATKTSSILGMLDSMCADLRQACGLTRLTVVLERPDRPLTISLEGEEHAVVPLGPSAYLEVPLREGPHPIGYVVLRNSLAADYTSEQRRVAEQIIVGFAPALRAALPG